MSLMMSASMIIIGFAALTKSADWFVDGAADIATRMGVSQLIIGLTVIALGTSAPEILVATFSSLDGRPAQAIGNAVGSNITNILLVAGATALISPFVVSKSIIEREIPILLLIMTAFAFLISDGHLGTTDGYILLAGLFTYIGRMVIIGLKSNKTKKTPSICLEYNFSSGRSSYFFFFVGLIGMMLSTKLAVNGASNVATYFGISDLIIGLTIMSIGTSMPEVIASIMSAIKGRNDMAVGGLIGSNAFNIMAVSAVPAILAPSSIPPDLLTRDVPIMLAALILFYAMLIVSKGANRVEGGVLVSLMTAYTVSLCVA